MSGNLPDGCTQSAIDRHCQGEWCGTEGHGEMNMDGTCDWCKDEQSPLDEPFEIDPELLDRWVSRSELFEPPRSDYHGD